MSSLHVELLSDRITKFFFNIIVRLDLNIFQCLHSSDHAIAPSVELTNAVRDELLDVWNVVLPVSNITHYGVNLVQAVQWNWRRVFVCFQLIACLIEFLFQTSQFLFHSFNILFISSFCLIDFVLSIRFIMFWIIYVLILLDLCRRFCINDGPKIRDNLW